MLLQYLQIYFNNSGIKRIFSQLCKIPFKHLHALMKYQQKSWRDYFLTRPVSYPCNSVGHSLSPVLPSGICFQTIFVITAVQKVHSNSRWRHTFSRSISTQSALDMFMTMRYTIFFVSSSSSSTGDQQQQRLYTINPGRSQASSRLGQSGAWSQRASSIVRCYMEWSYWP